MKWRKEIGYENFWGDKSSIDYRDPIVAYQGDLAENLFPYKTKQSETYSKCENFFERIGWIVK